MVFWGIPGKKSTVMVAMYRPVDLLPIILATTILIRLQKGLVRVQVPVSLAWNLSYFGSITASGINTNSQSMVGLTDLPISRPEVNGGHFLLSQWPGISEENNFSSP